MSDLDDLAAAASGGEPRGRQLMPPTAKPGRADQPNKPAAARVAAPPVHDERVAYEPPMPAAGLSPMTWVGLGAGIVVVLLLAFWLINRDRGTSPAPVARVGGTAGAQGAAAKAGAPDFPASGPTTSVSPNLGSPGTERPAGGGAPSKPASRPAPLALKDVEEPADAIEFAVTRDGDAVVIKARNVSRRGVFVRSMEFFAETDDRLPLDSIRFWIPSGGTLDTTYPMPILSDRLGEEEAVTGAIAEAEFSDTTPADLEGRPTEEGNTAEGAGDADEVDDTKATEQPAPDTKRGRKPAEQ